jgi:hypothetical protein
LHLLVVSPNRVVVNVVVLMIIDVLPLWHRILDDLHVGHMLVSTMAQEGRTDVASIMTIWRLQQRQLAH